MVRGTYDHERYSAMMSLDAESNLQSFIMILLTVSSIVTFIPNKQLGWWLLEN